MTAMMLKHQAPTSKLQRITNTQCPGYVRGGWVLGVIWALRMLGGEMTNV